MKTRTNEQEDLTGREFGRLKVLSREGDTTHKGCQWRCICSCPKQSIVLKNDWNLRNGIARSCGCLKSEVTAARSFKHGGTKGKDGKWEFEYRVWVGMKSRCNYKASKIYKYYGAKGIKVCKRWLNYNNFLQDMGRCPEGCCSIDRLNPKRNYCKSNCRWASSIQQGENRTDVIKIRYQGKTKPLTRWARDLGLNPQTVYDRYKRGDRGKHLFRPARNMRTK